VFGGEPSLARRAIKFSRGRHEGVLVELEQGHSRATLKLLSRRLSIMDAIFLVLLFALFLVTLGLIVAIDRLGDGT
jgi:hypothetical protein